MDSYGRGAVFEIVLLFVSLIRELAFFADGENPASSFTAAAAAKINPRASMPTPRRRRQV